MVIFLIDCWLAASRPGAYAPCIIWRRNSLTINYKNNCIEIRVGWANMNNFYCSQKRVESWTRDGNWAFCRNTTIHFLNFEIYNRSLSHEGRVLSMQVTNYGPGKYFPYYITTNPNTEDPSSSWSSNAWQLCMLSVVNCHQYL